MSKWRDRMEAGLFPPAPAPVAATARTRAIAAAVAALGVIVVLLRLGLVAPLDSVWAEDGGIFLSAALNDGFASAVAANYAGYLQLVPRLLAEPAAAVAPEWSAAVMALEGACVVVLCAFVVWWTSAGHLPDPRLRALMAAMVVLLPVVGYESLANLAYLWWFMLFAAFWVLLWRPRTAGRAVAGGAFLAATVMSAPLALALTPLAALRVWTARDARDWILVGAFALGGLAQGAAILFGEPAAEAPGPGWSLELVSAYLLRVVGGAMLGQYLDAAAWLVLGPLAVAAFAAAFAALVAWSARRGPARAISLTAIGLSVAFFMLGGYQRDLGETLMWPAGDATTTGARHTVAPALLLISVALIRLQHRPLAISEAAWRRVRTAAVAAICCVAAISFYVGNDFRWTPRWSAEIDAARAECARPGASSAFVAVAPEPWGLEVPCGRLRG